MPPRPRRILMISTHGYVAAQPELGLPDTGGQVVYVLELSRSLARMGYQVDIATRQFDNQPEREEVGPGVTLWRFPCGGPGFLPKETLCDSIDEWIDRASEWIAARNVAYHFVNTHYWDAGLAGCGLARRFGMPHLHTPHSIGVWKRNNMDGDPEALEREYNFEQRIECERNIYAESDLLIATTPQQKDILLDPECGVPEEKIRIAPPGYDDTRFFPVAQATRQAVKQELGLEGTIVLALGRIAHNKGYDLLIRSMLPIVKRVPDAKLVLAIGSRNPSQQEVAQVGALRSLAGELGLAERVVFQDYIPDEMLPDYYRAADVFALSSRYEPFGMTAIEAMACGTPTVVTTEGGLWEQVTWGLEALYANPYDTEAFGHRLCSVLLYPRAAAQLSQNGALKARACFTWTCVAQQILELAGEATGRASVRAALQRA